MDFIDLLITFLWSFILVYALYRIFIVRKHKEFDASKVRPEIIFMIKNYGLDFNKLDYYKVVKKTAFINSFLIAFTLAIISIVDSFWLQMLVAALLAFPLIYFSYCIMGKHYRKKMEEMVKK